MKLTTVLYSFLIFISCANNVTKEKQSGKITDNSSDPVAVVKENTEPISSAAKTEQSNTMPSDKEETENTNNTKDTMVPESTALVVEENKVEEILEAPINDHGSLNKEEKEVMEIAQDTKEEMEKQQEDKQMSSANDSMKENLFKVPSHDAWSTLLQKYVDNSGNVDYGAFKNSIAELSAYLDMLAQNNPQSDWSKNEKLAYYINLYNAATVKLILDNYPTKSIKDIKKPWGKNIVKVGNDLVSLGDIEHKILRKMDEPRIHFAINCASYSCPKLVNKAFTAAGMEQQLEAATQDFVNDTTRNQFSANEAQLSEIFKWYKGDFTEKGSLKDYINNYLATPMTASTKIKYLKYNWNLNEKQ